MTMTVGQRCEISGKRRGEIAYIGPVEGIPAGDWVGVRLDLTFGKNDGTQNGTKYFEAAPLHGVFVRPESVNVSEAFAPLLVVSDSLSLEEKVRVVENARAEQRESTQRKAALSEKDTRATAVDGFWKQFTEMETATRVGLDALQGQEPSPNLRAELDSLVARVQAMRDAAADASLYLPPYDIRQSQAILSRLLAEIETQRSALAPRKKFTFKARAKKAPAATTEAIPSPNAPTTPAIAPTALDHELIYADRSDEVLVIDAPDAPDLTLARLTNCIVCIVTPTSALRATALRNCHVLTGPIHGSLWLEDCTESSFTVACRQLRVHHCHNARFYLRISSHPIIEDCSNLGFAPYALQYDGLSAQLAAAGMGHPSPLYAQVHDFKWHRAQQSPHWYLVGADDVHPMASDMRLRATPLSLP